MNPRKTFRQALALPLIAASVALAGVALNTGVANADPIPAPAPSSGASSNPLVDNTGLLATGPGRGAGVGRTLQADGPVSFVKYANSTCSADPVLADGGVPSYQIKAEDQGSYIRALLFNDDDDLIAQSDCLGPIVGANEDTQGRFLGKAAEGQTIKHGSGAGTFTVRFLPFNGEECLQDDVNRQNYGSFYTFDSEDVGDWIQVDYLSDCVQVTAAEAPAGKPSLKLSDYTIKKGQTFRIRAKNLTPGDSYVIRAYGMNIYTGVVGDSGVVSKTYKYPAGAKSATRSIRVTTSSGDTMTFTKLVKLKYKR